MAEELLEDGGRVCGAVTSAGERIAARRRRRDGGNVPERPDAHGRSGRPRAAASASTRPRGLSRSLARARPASRPFQDRHAAAPAPRLDRLRRLRAAGGRRSAGAVLVPHEAAAGAPGPLLADGDQSRASHALIRENLHRSPMYSGQIRGVGPRYCPSVEDKVVRFADKPQHTIFLEPDGWDSEEIYVNGLSTSLPEDVQRAILARDSGARARADDPARLRRRVRLRLSRSAAALARGARGARASFSPDRSTARPATRRRRRRESWPASTRRSHVRGEAPFVLERSEAYAAVMIDDLTKKGLEEPYRLFTSRAEYRLLLGVDTVLPRLLPHGRRLGLISDGEYSEAMRSEARLREAEAGLRERVFNPSLATRSLFREKLGIELETPATAYKLLQRKDLTVERLESRRAARVRRARSRGAQHSRKPGALRGLHPTRARAARAAASVRVASDPREFSLRRHPGPFARGRSSSVPAESPGPSARPRGSRA